MKNLNPKIVEYFKDKLSLAPKTLRNNISKLSQEHPSLTKNALAQIYAASKKGNVLKFLDEEDRAALPQIKVKPAIEVKVRTILKKKQLPLFIELESEDRFVRGHVDELNMAYESKCYTACFILARKIVENLVIDILLLKYPEKILKNKELYFDTKQRRFKDFSVILKNLYDKRNDFGTKNKAVEKLYTLCLAFKDDANNKAHSWYHLVRNKDEIDKLQLKDIIDLINVISK